MQANAAMHYDTMTLMDQLGDLETTNPALIKQLRTLKCLPELSGETDVLWGTPN